MGNHLLYLLLLVEGHHRSPKTQVLDMGGSHYQRKFPLSHSKKSWKVLQKRFEKKRKIEKTRCKKNLCMQCSTNYAPSMKPRALTFKITFKMSLAAYHLARKCMEVLI